MTSALATVPSAPLGRIGKYPVLRPLGHGPEGSTYLAHDPFAGRDVAIKVFDPTAAAVPQAERRFRHALMSEAAAVGRLSHPHIAALHDLVMDDEICYVVMEHVPGHDLGICCESAALLPLGQALEIVFKSALALEYAHQHGVLHRNLKPSNILVRRGTEIKVSDFVCARAERYASGALPAPAALIHMSPEQLQDLPVTHQSDIYALGVIMYRLLTGRQPFYGSSDPELVQRIVTETPVLPSLHRPDLPAALEAVIMRALERDLGLRYATWADFNAELSDAYRLAAQAPGDASDTERFRTVRGLSFFRDFDDVEIWETLAAARFRRFPAGRVIMREGERGESFYILSEGEVTVTRAGAPLDVLMPGDCFGEMLYFSQASARRTTTITTSGPVCVLEVASTALRRASATCQVQFNKAFMRILIDRLTWANAKLAAA